MEQGHVHEHRQKDGTILRHSHAHVHQHTKTVLMHMQQMTEHLKAIREMVELGCDCSEVLVQLSKAENEIKHVGRIILKDHMEHCIVDAVKDGDEEALGRLNQAIDCFMR